MREPRSGGPGNFGRRSRRHVATLVAAVVATILVASAGDARAASTSAGVARSTESGVTTAVTGASQRVPADVIECDKGIEQPHKSTHVPTTINAVLTISCSGQVKNITSQVGIYYSNGNLARAGGVKNAPNVSSSNNNASFNCINQTYFAKATVTITYPDGYAPQTRTTVSQSANRVVNNC